MLQIGDKVRRAIKVYDPAGDSSGGKAAETTVDATVVYIHPELRFYTLECKMPGGRSFRETEYFYPRCGQAKS